MVSVKKQGQFYRYKPEEEGQTQLRAGFRQTGRWLRKREGKRLEATRFTWVRGRWIPATWLVKAVACTYVTNFLLGGSYD